jgi:tRNA nucleotidyltransferase (CCA-adding enzyme)
MSFQLGEQIIKKLNENGFEGFFVGGAVRDSLLGRPIGDIDIATSATPDRVLKIFPKTIPVGIEHGTVIVRVDHQSFEVTTFRKEGKYSDYRHPSTVDFISSIEEDLKRRDFTINAIAMTLKRDLIDPFDGQKDIKNKLIRTVGSADERFKEDPLRMMRGIRFVSSLGFELHSATRKSILCNNAYLEKIAVERITSEFEKILLGDSLKSGISELRKTKLYLYLPGLSEEMEALVKYASLPHLASSNVIEHWALFCYLAKIEGIRQFLKQWKLSNKKITEIDTLYQLLITTNNDINELMIYKFGLGTLQSLNRLKKTIGRNHYQESELENTYASLPIKSRKELAINGSDLMKWLNQSPGPWIEQLLLEIERAVVNRIVSNEVDAIKEWISWRSQFGTD